MKKCQPTWEAVSCDAVFRSEAPKAGRLGVWPVRGRRVSLHTPQSVAVMSARTVPSRSQRMAHPFFPLVIQRVFTMPCSRPCFKHRVMCEQSRNPCSHRAHVLIVNIMIGKWV